MHRNWIVAFLLLAGCGPKDSPAPKSTLNFTATSSFNANLSADEPFTKYQTEYAAIHAAGSKGAQTAALWGNLNPTGVTYDLTMVANPYFGLTTLASYGYSTIFLNIPIVNLAGRSMPADIAALTFDDPAVKLRFHALIDAIKDQIVSQVKYVALGNEVDTYFSTHPGEWTAYKSLVEDARTYLKSLKPNLIVGVTTTFDGATSKFASQIQNLNTNMDAVMLTYYPTSTSFVPRDPGTVSGDIVKMTGISLGKPLILQEWGYPSSTLLGSSEAKQAEFMSNSFIELEKQGATKFPFVSFFKYRDWNSGYVQSMTGQTAGQPFFEFMSSLGLLKNDGTPKQASAVVDDWINP